VFYIDIFYLVDEIQKKLNIIWAMKIEMHEKLNYLISFTKHCYLSIKTEFVTVLLQLINVLFEIMKVSKTWMLYFFLELMFHFVHLFIAIIFMFDVFCAFIEYTGCVNSHHLHNKYISKYLFQNNIHIIQTIIFIPKIIIFVQKIFFGGLSPFQKKN
ncbi:hypothetical protein RFI_37656, partial [Reticulomyxa filosa]